MFLKFKKKEFLSDLEQSEIPSDYKKTLIEFANGNLNALKHHAELTYWLIMEAHPRITYDLCSLGLKYRIFNEQSYTLNYDFPDNDFNKIVNSKHSFIHEPEYMKQVDKHMIEDNHMDVNNKLINVNKVELAGLIHILISKKVIALKYADGTSVKKYTIVSYFCQKHGLNKMSQFYRFKDQNIMRAYKKFPFLKNIKPVS